MIGENIGDDFGYSCSINSVGDIIAASGPSNNDSGNESGSTRVFQYNGTTWDQLGQDIDGEYAEEHVRPFCKLKLKWLYTIYWGWT
jgi:hypothetical protein